MQLLIGQQGCIGTRPYNRPPKAYHQRQGCVAHRSAIAAARAVITVDTPVVPEQQQTNAATPAASHAKPAAPRRRRRASTRSTDDKQPAQKAAAVSKQRSRNPRIPAYELFQQQSHAAQQGMVVTPARSAATLPADALSDPQEALNPTAQHARRGRPISSTSMDAEQQQLLAQFEPFSQSFQQVAQQLATRQQQPNSSSSSQASAAAQAEAAWRSSSDTQRGSKRSKGNQKRTNRLIELFGMPSDQSQTTGSDTASASARRVALEAPDTLAQQPTQSRLAAQRLASLLMQQQQQRKQKRQQVAEQDEQQQQDESQEQAAAAQQTGASKERPVRLLPTAVPQQGTTRLYVPAPSVNEATSAADRQPLRLLSIRQQHQMRQEARQQAIQKLREKAVQEYQACLDRTLNWQGTGQYTYFPDAPRFLPVALQRNWIPSSSSSAPDAADDSQAADTKLLSPSDTAAVKAINQIVTRQLGSGAALPDRAFKGERGLYLASLSPQAAADRLKRWASCCGQEYVTQLIKREPCLLGLEPQALLKTLEALNRTLQLPTQACVEFVSKNVVVVGLDADELKGRVQGLKDAVGLNWDDTVQLAQARPQLLMVHPSHIKGQMDALAKLLPEAAPKLPQAVKRSPFLILKSPRAIARSIQELAECLGLSTWATARLVAGQPSILSSNFDALQKRLERLQTLTAASKRWQRQLQALSPPLLARCLACSDATIDRLALLIDVGAAGASRLPPIQLILTMPENFFQELLADMAERQLKRQQQIAAAEDDETSSAAAVSVTNSKRKAMAASTDGSRRKAATSSNGIGEHSGAPVAQSAAGKRLLQQLGLSRGQTLDSSSNSRQYARPDTRHAKPANANSVDDDDVADDASDISDKAVREGVLGGDMVWRSTLASLADALQASVAGLAAGGKGKAAAPAAAVGRGKSK